MRRHSFEENYFKGEKSNYRSCYDYKTGNIALVYKERVRKSLKTYFPQGGTALDVGCAFGDLLALLDKESFTTYGIDISKYALRIAGKNTNAKLIQGDLNKKLPYKDSFFDCIFAFDIIEHLESPHGFLMELYRVLKKGGVLFIQTPNINSFFEILYKDAWFGYKDETHLHLFTRKSLKFLLQKSHFQVIRNETFAGPFPSFVRNFIKNTDIGGNIWMEAKKVK